MIALIDLNRDTTWAPASSRPGTGGVHSQAQQQDLAYSRWTDAQRIAYHPMQAGRYCGLRHRWELQAAQTYGILARRTRTDAQRIAHRPAHGLLARANAWRTACFRPALHRRAAVSRLRSMG